MVTEELLKHYLNVQYISSNIITLHKKPIDFIKPSYGPTSDSPSWLALQKTKCAYYLSSRTKIIKLKRLPINYST